MYDPMAMAAASMNAIFSGQKSPGTQIQWQKQEDKAPEIATNLYKSSLGALFQLCETADEDALPAVYGKMVQGIKFGHSGISQRALTQEVAIDFVYGINSPIIWPGMFGLTLEHRWYSLD